jgi:hypothetical protein
MRLSSYPYVVVRVACTKCSRAGSYRLARLADRYGAEAQMNSVLTMLSADCKLAERNRPGIDRCGAYFLDLTDDGPRRPPDEFLPRKRPFLKIVGEP